MNFDDVESLSIIDGEVFAIQDKDNKYLWSKNLFDKNNPNILNTAIDGNGLGGNFPNTYRTVYVPCFPNTTYTISKTKDATKNRFTVAYTASEPTYNMTEVYGMKYNNNASSLSITTGSNAAYLVAYVWIVGGTETANDMVSSVQIKIGAW